MAVQRFTENVEIISGLSDSPSTDGSLTTNQFKAKFDQAAKLIKIYLNEVLAPAIDSINASSVVVGATKPTNTPALWFDTSESEGGS